MFPPDGGSSPGWASSPLKLEQEIKAEMQVSVSLSVCLFLTPLRSLSFSVTLSLSGGGILVN